MKTIFEQLLHAVNILGKDVDIDIKGGFRFAACPPLYLTPYGRECFKKALACNAMLTWTMTRTERTCTPSSTAVTLKTIRRVHFSSRLPAIARKMTL